MDGPRGIARRALWTHYDPLFNHWTADSLADPESSPTADRMQAALVALAQSGDVDAAHTLLLQLKPALLAIARTSFGQTGSNAENCAEVQSAFFETLYRHPLQRRPSKIAANLVLDTRRRTGFARHLAGRVELGIDSNLETPGGTEPAAAIGPRMDVLPAIRSVLEDLPGTPGSRQLTATLAFRAWILEEQLSNIATDLGLERQTVAMRLYRLRQALHETSVRELLAA